MVRDVILSTLHMFPPKNRIAADDVAFRLQSCIYKTGSARLSIFLNVWHGTRVYYMDHTYVGRPRHQ